VCLQTAQLFLDKILFFNTNFVKISWILEQQILILEKKEEEEDVEKNFLSPIHSLLKKKKKQ
jgi:hypothetical protein